MAYDQADPPVLSKELVSEEKVVEERNGRKVEVLKRRYRVRKPWKQQWEEAKKRQAEPWKFPGDEMYRRQENIVEVGKPATIQYAHLNTANLGFEAQAAKTIQTLQQRVALRQELGSGGGGGLFQVNKDASEKPGESQDWRASGASAPPSGGPALFRPTSVSTVSDDTSRTLKVSNIAPNTPAQALRDLLNDRFGRENIVRFHLRQSDRDTGHPRGFGFVTFSTRTLAETALREFTEKAPSIDHRVLTFDWARAPAERSGGGPPAGGDRPPPM